MAGYTHLDEIIDYNNLVITKVLNSPDVMKLVSNGKYAPDDDDAEKWEEHINDHGWIDESVQEAGAYVLVDTEVTKAPSGSTKTMTLLVEVVCNKSFMKLDTNTFPGIKGNRRDNICRQVDLLINGSTEFGIGRLQLTSATLAAAPEGFTARLLTYTVPDYARDRSKVERRK